MITRSPLIYVLDYRLKRSFLPLQCTVKTKISLLLNFTHFIYDQLEKSKQKQTRLTQICNFFYDIYTKIVVLQLFPDFLLYVVNPIPTGHGRNKPIYERQVTKSGRNRVKFATVLSTQVKELPKKSSYTSLFLKIVYVPLLQYFDPMIRMRRLKPTKPIILRGLFFKELRVGICTFALGVPRMGPKWRNV